MLSGPLPAEAEKDAITTWVIKLSWGRANTGCGGALGVVFWLCYIVLAVQSKLIPSDVRQ